jgi:hypothetical protein
MADTTLFGPEATLGRPPRDILESELKNKIRALEVQLNTDRAFLDTQREQSPLSGYKLFSGQNPLTDATSFDLFTIPIAALGRVAVRVLLAVASGDGTDMVCEMQTFDVAAVNKAGTVTAVVTVVSENGLAASGSKTLGVTAAAAEDTADLLFVSITADPNITPTDLVVSWEATVFEGGPLTAKNSNAA